MQGRTPVFIPMRRGKPYKIKVFVFIDDLCDLTDMQKRSCCCTDRGRAQVRAHAHVIEVNVYIRILCMYGV